MNIAVFPSAFHPHVGGVEELSRQLVHQLDAQGHHAIVITNRWPRNLPAFEEFDGIPVYRLPFRTCEQSLKSKFSYHLTHKRVSVETRRVVERHAIDVIHVQCVSSNAHYALRAAEGCAKPLVVTLQGELTMDATGLFQRSKWARVILREILENADYVTACSEHTLAEAEEFLGKSLAAKAEVIHNGIRHSELHNAIPYVHPRAYLLAIGRLVPQKGFDILLEAVALLCQRGRWQGDLILAGDGPDRESLCRLAAKLGVASRVVFAGRVDRKQVASLFAGCDFFVLPSRHEPFGIVNLEAMASGKAVVATSVGGVPEFVIHGETGWLVPPCDPSALANGIEQVGGDGVLKRRIAEQGELSSRKYDWQAVASRYEAVYRSVLSAGRGVPTEFSPSI